MVGSERKLADLCMAHGEMKLSERVSGSRMFVAWSNKECSEPKGSSVGLCELVTAPDLSIVPIPLHDTTVRL